MRIQHMVFTVIALTTLFGCGTNNTESMDNRQFDRIENVRNQPRQGEMSRDDLNQFPGGSRNTTEQSPNINNHQLKQKRDDSFGGNMLEDGQVDRYDQRRDNNKGSVNESKGQTDFNKQDIQKRSNQGGEYRVAKQIADDVTSEVNEINSAYVLTMGNNAYVACKLDNNRESKQNNDLSDKLEKQVTQVVKNSDNKIENVYVSSNPDFIDLTSNYMRDLDRGEPIEGFFDQFTEMIERVFPTRNR